MSAAIHFDDLTPEQRSKIGLRKPRESSFTKEDVRSWSLRTLAAMASLSAAERQRVLKHALKVNGI